MHSIQVLVRTFPAQVKRTYGYTYLGCFPHLTCHTEWPEGLLSFTASILYFTEESLKDGAQLKQLLLKALTLMLDAAESYAKVTQSYSSLARIVLVGNTLA